MSAYVPSEAEVEAAAKALRAEFVGQGASGTTWEDYEHEARAALVAAHTATPDEPLRPWVVEIESTLINGEDDVMSPEPPEVVWAASADEAHDALTRDYDTNLLGVRPATPADFAPTPREDVAARDSLRECVVNVAWLAKTGIEKDGNGYCNAAADALAEIVRRIPQTVLDDATNLTPTPPTDMVPAAALATEVGGE